MRSDWRPTEAVFLSYMVVSAILLAVVLFALVAGV